jgi:sugar/nucleoside kinase (ribokinase family)
MTGRLLVVGGASLDVLHFGGRTSRSAGGAGLYTSLAARRAGVPVTMIGPRPEPMPPELAPAAARIEWIGPPVSPDRLPTFEIAHLGAGRTEIKNIYWRSEANLSPADLPSDLSHETVYCIGLTDPERQLAFVRHMGSRDRRVACGTYSCAVKDHADVVREILEVADIFFCNESEAVGLFASLEAARTAPGKVLFITRGARGARVIQGDHATDILPVLVEELDPTGAGDTFCGTVLAFLAQGAHPVLAAERGVAAAAEMITGVGPEALFRDSPPPVRPRDPRFRVADQQVGQVARLIGALPDVKPFEFMEGPFPPRGHPRAVDFFFAATLQQFGFWTVREGRYAQPMIGHLGGMELKGSDFLWAAYRRWLDADAEALTPEGQAGIDQDVWAYHTRGDEGTSPLPDPGLRRRLAHSYGRDMMALGWTASGLLQMANASNTPLATFLSLLDRVGGYKEDPFRKKSALLAIILQQRPERFLRCAATETVPPIVDYHVQRSCLRMGLVRVEDDDLRQRLESREVLPAEDERAIRRASYEAMARLERVSGRSMGAVDYFFFQNRERCPEMTPPDCARCPVDPVCAHATALFQPVFRTSAY